MLSDNYKTYLDWYWRKEEMKPPCLGCTDRHPGCHNDSCTHGWSEYEQSREDFRNNIAEKKAVERSTDRKRSTLNRNLRKYKSVSSKKK